MTVVSNRKILENPDTYELIGKNEQTVYKQVSVLKRGVNEHSGKTWARFQRSTMRCFSWKSGRLRLYNMGRHHGQVFFYDGTTQMVQETLFQNRYADTALNDLVAEAKGKATIREVVAAEYPLALEIPAARGITPLLALPNVQEFTRAYFGPSRYRKDLVRGVASRGWLATGGTDTLVMMKAFAPLVPTDWIARALLDMPAPSIYDLMRSGMMPATNPYSGDFAAVRRMLRTASPKQVRALFRDQTKTVIYNKTDALRQFYEIRTLEPGYRLEELHFSNWKELHDLLPGERRKFQNKNQPIDWSDEAKTLAGPLDDGYEIILPADTHTLIDWGQRMNNCIGSYGTYAGSRSLLYAVLKDGEMIANMELSPGGRILQLVAKHNADLPAEHKTPVHAAVLRAFPQPGMEPLADWERELLDGPVEGAFF